MKRCTVCGETKPLDQFHNDYKSPGGRGGYGKRGPCKACYHAKTLEWRNRNLARANGYQRTSQLRRALREFGLDSADYERLVAECDGRCQICGRVPTGQRTRLSIDHDHVTGEVRGLLCNACNLVLGKFEDDPDRFEAAAAYLRSSTQIPYSQ